MSVRDEFFAQERVAWQRISNLLAGLDELEMAQSQVLGEWTIKDILAHVGTWQGRALSAIQRLATGQRIERIEDFDTLNAESYQRDRHLPLAEARARFEANHAALMDFLGTLSEEQLFGGKLMHLWVTNATASHLNEHAQSIEQWLGRRPSVRAS